MTATSHKDVSLSNRSKAACTAFHTDRLYRTEVGLCAQHEDEYQQDSDLYRAETYHPLDVGIWLRWQRPPQPTSNDAMRDAVALGQTAWLL